MFNTSKIKNNNRPAVLFLLVVLLASLNSCQQEFGRLIPEREPNDSVDVTFGTPRVLYLIVDGARGESVRTAQAPHINGLLGKSIYSWVSLSDEEVTEKGTNWTDMLSGVRKNKHGVLNNDFSRNSLDAFPLVYERLKSADPTSDIRVYTTSQLFKDNLTRGVDQSEVLATDENVKDAVLQSLAIDTINFVTGHFVNVDAAGAQFGYDNSHPEYKESILQFDTYLGEILSALEQRPAYEQENWLIIVASSRGGHFPVPDEQNDNTIFSNPDVNTFTIYHAPRYNTRFIAKPFLGNRFQGDFVRFDGQRKAQVDAGDNSVYNLGTAAFTIELKVKKNRGPNNNYQFRYPAVLGKRPEWSSGWPSVGWVVFLEDKYWMFNARGTGDGNQVRGADLADATWNSIAVVGVIRDGQRFVRTFTNGNFNNESNVQSWGNFDNNTLLTMGYINGSGHGEPDVYVADVRIWKAALPDDVVKQYACEIGVDAGHPYYDFLAGYWPVAGSTDNTILDEGPLGSHMTMSGGDFTSSRLAEFLCAPSIDDLGSLVPRSVDVPAQILSWLKIPRQESWQLDGRVWLDQ